MIIKNLGFSIFFKRARGEFIKFFFSCIVGQKENKKIFVTMGEE